MPASPGPMPRRPARWRTAWPTGPVRLRRSPSGRSGRCRRWRCDPGWPCMPATAIAPSGCRSAPGTWPMGPRPRPCAGVHATGRRRRPGDAKRSPGSAPDAPRRPSGSVHRGSAAPGPCGVRQAGRAGPRRPTARAPATPVRHPSARPTRRPRDGVAVGGCAPRSAPAWSPCDAANPADCRRPRPPAGRGPGSTPAPRPRHHADRRSPAGRRCRRVPHGRGPVRRTLRHASSCGNGARR